MFNLLAMSTSPSENQQKIAPLWRRLFAMIYDGFLLFGISMLVGAFHISIKAVIFGKNSIETSPTAGGDFILFIIWILAIFLFYFFFWRNSGQTLGMQSWRLKIVSLKGENISISQCMIRFFVAILSIVILGLGYLWCFLGKHRTWHDIASDTNIILLEK
jgi:uncharacterized RDD family membrane protein YckC